MLRPRMAHSDPLPTHLQIQVKLSLDTPDLAETYDRVGHRQFDHGKLLISDLEVLPGHHVLDIGSGTGLLGNYVAKKIGPEGQVIGIDPLPHRIDVAQRRTAANFQVKVGRAEDLSEFPDDHFDIVYYNSVFHWIPDKALALREAKRVLKPGGRLGISTAAKECPNDLEKILANLLGQSISRSVIRKVDSRALSNLFTETGLSQALLEIRSFTDQFADVDEVLAFNISSSFGNAFADLDEGRRTEVRTQLESALEVHRLHAGSIQLQRNLIFAVARKG